MATYLSMYAVRDPALQRVSQHVSQLRQLTAVEIKRLLS